MLTGSIGLSEFTELRVKKREETQRLMTSDEVAKFCKKKGNEKAEQIESIFQVSVTCLPFISVFFYQLLFSFADIKVTLGSRERASVTLILIACRQLTSKIS